MYIGTILRTVIWYLVKKICHRHHVSFRRCSDGTEKQARKCFVLLTENAIGWVMDVPKVPATEKLSFELCDLKIARTPDHPSSENLWRYGKYDRVWLIICIVDHSYLYIKYKSRSWELNIESCAGFPVLRWKRKLDCANIFQPPRKERVPQRSNGTGKYRLYVCMY